MNSFTHLTRKSLTSMTSNTAPPTTKSMAMTTRTLAYAHTQRGSINTTLSFPHPAPTFDIHKRLRTPEQTTSDKTHLRTTGADLDTDPPQGSPPETNLDESEIRSGGNDDCRPDVVLTWGADEVKSERGEEMEVVDLVEESRTLRAFRGMVGGK